MSSPQTVCLSKVSEIIPPDQTFSGDHSRCGATGDSAHTVTHCPKYRRRTSEDRESQNPPIPTPMEGHLINRRNIEKQSGANDAEVSSGLAEKKRKSSDTFI